MPVPRLSLFAIAAALTLPACATKQLVRGAPPAPVEASSTQASPLAAPAGDRPVAQRHYVVRKGDSLWSIAGRRDVLGDPFAWPLLYRLNRDQISDPDLIFVRQELGYEPGPDAEALAEARKMAAATPAYTPKRRRKTLPLG
jgi:nucleoid-associated protein YgaU